MERVADYIINRLTEIGIKHIFLITGRGILYLTDAVAKCKNIEAISTYHEQGASYAAMAYAACTDGMAACLVSTGCAATNAVTAALCAFQDNLPVIFLSGQNPLGETTRFTGQKIRTYGSQEADIISVVESITKYSVMLTKPNDVRLEMDKIIWFANEGRKGPVWIDVPLDVQNAKVDETLLEGFCPEENSLVFPEGFFDEIIDDINSAKRPLFFIGGGLRSSGAIDLFSNLVQETSIPVVFSTAAADAFGSADELSLGAVGTLGGSRTGNFAVQNADLIIAIGTKLTSQSIGDRNEFAREAKLIVVDIDPDEHKKNDVHIDKLLNVDAKIFIEELVSRNIKKCNYEWVKLCKHWKEIFDISRESFIQDLVKENKIDIYHFADILSAKLYSDSTVITDAGMEELIIPSTIKYKHNQRCIFPAAQGAMGYAIPAIIGAHYAGKRNIVTVVGDGSIMMNIQELLLIGNRKIPVKIFVINNNMYAVIRKRQKDLFRSRTIGNDPSDGLAAPNFKSIADCFGMEYQSIINERDLSAGIDKALKTSSPLICEVHCVEDQKYLHTSFAFNEKRKMVKRPLEDLSPFIDRELFRREMVIEPINS